MFILGNIADGLEKLGDGLDWLVGGSAKKAVGEYLENADPTVKWIANVVTGKYFWNQEEKTSDVSIDPDGGVGVIEGPGLAYSEPEPVRVARSGPLNVKKVVPQDPVEVEDDNNLLPEGWVPVPGLNSSNTDSDDTNEWVPRPSPLADPEEPLKRTNEIADPVPKENPKRTNEIADPEEPDRPDRTSPITDPEKDASGTGQTPGFWKNHIDIYDQELSPSLGPEPAHNQLYEDVFGVDLFETRNVSDPDALTLEDALNIRGGGQEALLRASSASLANAASDDLNFNYSSIQAGDNRDVLEQMDLNHDMVVSTDELKNAVQDLYTDGDTALGTDFFDFSDAADKTDVTAVAEALDAMNNLPHLDTSEFLAAEDAVNATGDPATSGGFQQTAMYALGENTEGGDYQTDEQPTDNSSSGWEEFTQSIYDSMVEQANVIVESLAVIGTGGGGNVQWDVEPPNGMADSSATGGMEDIQGQLEQFHEQLQSYQEQLHQYFDSPL